MPHQDTYDVVATPIRATNAWLSLKQVMPADGLRIDIESYFCAAGFSIKCFYAFTFSPQHMTLSFIHPIYIITATKPEACCCRVTIFFCVRVIIQNRKQVDWLQFAEMIYD
eukprot:scaffold4213_cov78-Skeletonema_dohrnii-CCMP3373.AAC.3